MNTLIGILLVSLCALAIMFIGWIVRKVRAGNEPEIETEHDWDAARLWERRN